MKKGCNEGGEGNGKERMNVLEEEMKKRRNINRTGRMAGWSLCYKKPEKKKRGA